MSDQEWFRKTTWTESDREDFFAHLERSRKTSRAQYLNIQAIHLYETKRSEEITAALELANLALEKYPERFFLAGLLGLKAKCLDELGKLKEAEDNFLLAIQAMREVPNVKLNIQFSFAFFVIKHKISRLYNEALMFLDEFNDIGVGTTLPATEYYFYGMKAIILHRERRFREAKPLALKAIAASEMQYSGFPRHPEVGLVNKNKDVFYDMFYNEVASAAQ